MNTEASKLLSKLEGWFAADLENRAAAVALSDDKTGNYYVHYAGPVNKIAKCVNAIMEDDLETAMGIYIAATLFAHKNLAKEFIEDTNANCARVAALRKAGKSSDEIHDIMNDKLDN